MVKRVENEDLARLYEYLTGPDVVATFAGARNLSMISFLLDTGIRRGELLSMKIGSLNLDQLRCHVNGKTGHRYVPFSPSCRDALRRYLQHPDYPGPINPNNPGSAETALWLTYQGKELTYYGFSEVIRKIVRKSGVKFYAHRLRHTFATLMASRVSVFDLKDLLGHTSVSTTQIYVQQNMEHLAEVHKGNSPLSMLTVDQTIKRARGRPRKRDI